MELETLKKENYELARELEDLKCKETCVESSDVVCGMKNDAQQGTWKWSFNKMDNHIGFEAKEQNSI